jgi:predicted nucleic acid-binding protein
LEAEIALYCAESTITTIDFILQKVVEKKLLRTILSEILDVVTVLPCSNATIKNALSNQHTDLEDAILYEIAKAHQIDYFVTNDQQALKKLNSAVLPVINSTRILAAIED